MLWILKQANLKWIASSCKAGVFRTLESLYVAFIIDIFIRGMNFLSTNLWTQTLVILSLCLAALKRAAGYEMLRKTGPANCECLATAMRI